MTHSTPTPAAIARAATTRRNAARLRDQQARRRNAASKGYRGPLTRAELAAQASR